jgi:hypothetical protein
MKDSKIKELIENGYIRVNVIFEVIGHPKKHVEDTIKAYVANIKTDEGVEVLKEEYDDVEEINKNVFSVVAEVEMLLKGTEKLTWLCLNFAPASIEIIEPDKIIYEQRDINHWLNDLLAKLHEIGIIQKKIASQNEGLIRNFNAMTRNAILLVLKEPSDIKTVSSRIGMQEEHTEQFMEALIKENKIKKEKTIYHLIH